MSQNPKSTKPSLQSKQRDGGTKNKHCKQLIYTVPHDRSMLEHCYSNIQTINWRNTAELRYFYNTFSGRFLKPSKNTKIYISQNPKSTKSKFAIKTTERGNQKQTLESAVLHSTTQQIDA